MAHNTIHGATNVHSQEDRHHCFQQHTWKRSRAQSSSAQPESSSEQYVGTMDKKLTDSLWAVACNRDREHKETRLTLVTRQATQVKE